MSISSRTLKGSCNGENFHSSRIRRHSFLRTLPLGSRQLYRFDQRRIIGVRPKAINPVSRLPHAMFKVCDNGRAQANRAPLDYRPSR